MGSFHVFEVYLVAFALGIVAGKVAALAMPSLKLSWTWTPVSLAFAVYVMPSVGMAGQLQVFAATASGVAMLSYLSAKVRGIRKRDEKLITPLTAIKHRWARVFVSAVLLFTLVHHVTVHAVVIWALMLGVMWG